MFRTFKSRAGVAALALVLAAGVAVAAGGADTAKQRVLNMKAMGGSAKALLDQAKSDAPDAAVVKAQAAKLAGYAAAIPTWFPKGSWPESGVPMRALPAIWTDWAGFSAAQQSYAAAVNKVNTAAAAGDMAGFKAAMPAVFGGCKSCHDKYRGPELPHA